LPTRPTITPLPWLLENLLGVVSGVVAPALEAELSAY
jgi:hypothetical protein